MKSLRLENTYDKDLTDIARCLERSKKVIVVSGAGISVNSGIPDFRSEQGLYKTLGQDENQTTFTLKGEDLFHVSVLGNSVSASVFIRSMSGLQEKIQNSKPTKTHGLIRLLDRRKSLIRCYTQNFDGLEEKLGLGVGTIPKGLSKSKVIQLHGDIHTLRCTKCTTVVNMNDAISCRMQEGVAEPCPSCVSTESRRLAMNLRARGPGCLRPNIVLYGEHHPESDKIGDAIAHDLQSSPTFLLVVGTSLKVAGVKNLTRAFAKQVKKANGIVVFVNKTPVATSAWKNYIDFHIGADCDAWLQDLKRRVPQMFSVQTQINTVKVSRSKKRRGENEIADANRVAKRVFRSPLDSTNIR